MCAKIAHVTDDVAGWQALGERVALARSARGLSQSDVSAATGIERTAFAKIESGARRVSALELARLARALGRSVSWFVVESPAPIVSRRAELVHERSAAELDAELLLEDLSLDVGGLLELGALRVGASDIEIGQIDDVHGAEEAAARVRVALGDEDGPLPGMAEVLGRLGLLVYTDDLGDALDGLAVRLDDGVGVCLVNSRSDPGRRRATAAHELGHYLFDDAYSVEHLSASSGDEREGLIDAFAGALLLPERALRAQWETLSGERGARFAAVAIAARYRVSWSSLRHRVRRLGLVSGADAHDLTSSPVKAEFVASGLVPEPDLSGVSVPPLVGEAAMAAYARDDISGDRALEILRGTVDEMPPRPMLSMYALRGDFYSDQS